MSGVCKIPTLTYFNTAGRAFALRVALFQAFGKDGWVDVRIEFSDWAALKPTTSLGSLPNLSLPSGAVVAQTDALTRWAGKQGNLYPTDIDEALLVDEVMTTSFEALNKCPGGATPEEKKTAREEYAAGFLTTALTALEKRVTPGPWVAGDDLSIGDLTLLMLTEMICIGDFDYVPGSLVTDNFPGLVAHRTAVKEHSLLTDYLANYLN
jgi:glutathione S-transferase